MHNRFKLIFCVTAILLAATTFIKAQNEVKCDLEGNYAVCNLNGTPLEVSVSEGEKGALVAASTSENKMILVIDLRRGVGITHDHRQSKIGVGVTHDHREIAKIGVGITNDHRTNKSKVAISVSNDYRTTEKAISVTNHHLVIELDSNGSLLDVRETAPHSTGH
ncbi:MAG TPA: hypothetical protein PK239_13675 [Chitinophagales bacterium]|nr:hypothetical protein [Chitinophagales bacterium]HRK28319.1 hypothetical protein [Chitinophagales bacterium]